MTGNDGDNPGVSLPPQIITQLATLDTRMDAIERAVNQYSKGAHARMDKIEKSFSEQLREIRSDVKDILSWVNRSKGGLATILTLIAIVGGVVGALVISLLGR